MFIISKYDVVNALKAYGTVLKSSLVAFQNMPRVVFHHPKSFAPENHDLWIVEDGKGTSKVLTTPPPKNQTVQEPPVTPKRNPPLILEPKWVPSQPVYDFPIHL